MAPQRSGSAIGTTVALPFSLIANLISLMTFPAVLPAISRERHLGASEAGWIGGRYFAGHVIAAFFRASATR